MDIEYPHPILNPRVRRPPTYHIRSSSYGMAGVSVTGSFDRVNLLKEKIKRKRREFIVEYSYDIYRDDGEWILSFCTSRTEKGIKVLF